MDLRTALHVLRTTWLSVLVVALAGGVLALGYALAQPKSYQANASGIVQAGSSSDLGGALAGENFAKSRVKSYLDVAHSRSVARRVIDDLNLKTTPQELVSTIEATNPIDTAVIQITVAAGDPQLAARTAEAWIGGITAEVKDIEGSPGDGKKSVVRFRSLDSAVVPTSASSPNVKLIVALGLFLGLGAGLAQAFVRALLDRRIRRPAQVESELGLSVIGSVPKYAAIDSGRRVADAVETGADEASFAVAESLRELRTNLRFMDVDDPPRVIAVTSSLPAEGKSTIAANLARTVAQNGDPVILVDADLRRPTVAKTFGLPTGAGLTDVLTGAAELEDVLQEATGDGTLQILAAGRVPPNPSELLGSQAMRTALADLAGRGLVLIDAPPLLPVTDAAVLSAATDGALVVGRCGKTTLDTVQQALQSVERVNGRALGFIINAVPLRGSRSYAYSYKYKYGYGKVEQPGRPAIVPEAAPMTRKARRARHGRTPRRAS